MNVRYTFRKALKDPILKGIDYIGRTTHKEISDIIKDLPEDAYISEWRHSLGRARYEYHIHTNGAGDKLVELYSRNIRGGNPELVHLYSKKELKSIIQKAQKEGYS